MMTGNIHKNELKDKMAIDICPRFTKRIVGLLFIFVIIWITCWLSQVQYSWSEVSLYHSHIYKHSITEKIAKTKLKESRSPHSLGRNNTFLKLHTISRSIKLSLPSQASVTDINANRSNIHQPERRHIAFLKVHKAASSTAQNIFLRFAMQRDLLVVLPQVPKLLYPNIISEGGTVTSKNILAPPKDRYYQILCCHVLYNREAFKRIMPKDTVYIGIVRDPFDHFMSVLNYFRPKKVLDINVSHPVSEFLFDPLRFEKRRPGSYVNNRMAYEYNFPADLFETRNETGIQNYLKKLDLEFELVIVVELFDESVVLMRRLLNWSVKDILYIKQNVKQKLFEKIKFNSGDVEMYQRWAELDYALYDYFFQRLQTQIQAQGSDFLHEVLYFKRLRRDMELFCQKHTRSPETTVYFVTASQWGGEFNITMSDCKYMTKGEIPYIKEIRLHQYGEFEDNPPKMPIVQNGTFS